MKINIGDIFYHKKEKNHLIKIERKHIADNERFDYVIYETNLDGWEKNYPYKIDMRDLRDYYIKYNVINYNDYWAKLNE